MTNRIQPGERVPGHENTHIDRVNFLVFLVIATVGKGCALTAKDKAVWEET
jgi:hypothetical protein